MDCRDRLLEVFTIKELMALMLAVDYAVNNVDENTEEEDILTLQSLKTKLNKLQAFDNLYEKGVKDGVKLILDTQKNTAKIEQIKEELHIYG